MKRWQRTSGRLTLGFAVVSLLAGLNGASANATTSRLQLDIASRICVVDVVQDGGGEVVQIPSEECEIILPQLLTIVPTDEGTPSAAPLFALPFAGVPSSEPVAVQPVADSPWSSIASTKPSGDPASITQMVPLMAGGVALVVTMTLVGVDVVLFEFGHSMRIGRWLRGTFTRP
jgi:hypothetical protein